MTTTTGIPTVSSRPPAESHRAKGLAALLLGVTGLVIGIGVGVRWLAAGAITWESIVAIVVFSGALVLTGWGVIRATDGMTPIWRAVAGFLLAMAVALLVWTFTPAVIATRVPPRDHPAGDFGLGGHEVHFATADGVRLWGWYVPPPDGKVIVLRHGAGSTASDVRQQASVLVANGYGLLMTDARGHGRSEGTAMDFGWYGDEDIAAAVTFLAQQPGVDAGRIAVVGMSMGGEEAIGAMAADDRIRAVVAEGATARTDADKAWLEDVYGWRGWIQTRLEWMQYTMADLLTGAAKPDSLASAARSASPRPILMITAGEAPDEARAAGFIAAGTDNVTIWTVPDAGHIQGLAQDPEEWEARVVGFLDGAFGRHS
jgi:pimeloyl-ACP methyl ester carboxylesterase